VILQALADSGESAIISVTDQLMQDVASHDEIRDQRRGSRSRLVRVLPPLAGALICSGLIVEAIVTAMGARANGDAMVMFCPILGAVFLTIPAGQAWWAVVKIICQ
jgi:hypothetical protein